MRDEYKDVWCVCRWVRGLWRSCVCVWPLWTLRWSRRSRRSVSATRPRGNPSWTPLRPKNGGSRTSEKELPNSLQQHLEVLSHVLKCELLSLILNNWSQVDVTSWFGKLCEDFWWSSLWTSNCWRRTSTELFSVWQKIIIVSVCFKIHVLFVLPSSDDLESSRTFLNFCF